MVDLKKQQQASIFDYFRHIELIPLETNNNVVVGSVGKIIFHQNRYYVFDEHHAQEAVHIFDESGKFIFTINKRGKGPGEYTELTDVIINPFTGNLNLLNPWGFVIIYDLQGNYVKTSHKVTNAELPVVHKLIALNDKIFVFYSGYRNPKIIYYDMEEMKILHQEYEENPALHVFWGKTFYEYRGQWYFYRLFDNAIYELSSNSMVKSYTLDFGKHNYNVNKMGNLFQIKDPRNDPKKFTSQFSYILSEIGQNNRYVMAQIRLPKEDRLVNIMYDKSVQQCKLVGQFDESVGFNPIVVTNEFVLSHCYHGELYQYVNEEMLDELNRKKLEDIMKIKEELNPVVIKYYFN